MNKHKKIVGEIIVFCLDKRKEAIDKLDAPNASKDNYRCYFEGKRDAFQEVRVKILDLIEPSVLKKLEKQLFNK